jgi:maltose alpha-D-glucosyltransferase/alpha-amylase
MQTLLGGPAAEQSRLLGLRTAMLHSALASGSKDFIPESFSLHYQRSLFSSMQSLVRETYQSLERNMKKFPPDVKEAVAEFKNQKAEIINELKKIYAKKLAASKIRIHGNLHLQQFLLTGKDVAIHDFGGNPHRNYSERRLKRSPLRDVASMVRSFHYVAYKAFFNTIQVGKEEIHNLLPFAGIWAQYMSSFFLNAYLEKIESSSLIPSTKEDKDLMLRTYILEGAIHDLNYELNNRPEYIVVPLGLINSILDKAKV